MLSSSSCLEGGSPDKVSPRLPTWLPGFPHTTPGLGVPVNFSVSSGSILSSCALQMLSSIEKLPRLSGQGQNCCPTPGKQMGCYGGGAGIGRSRVTECC
jgi:hypothetical protein